VVSSAVAAAAAERAARESYGRLLAVLAAPTGNIPAAEDALSDAFERALTTWPHRGIPDNPEGWLLTVARNRLRDLYRSAAHRQRTALADDAAAALPAIDALDLEAIPDRRLALLFVCAHPAIDVNVRTPLMLQLVLGFDADHMARAFAIPATTLAQRLVRAKRRIKALGIRFEVPDRSVMADRLPPVLEAIYGAFAIDEAMRGEALYLARTLSGLLDDEPEALGLAALLSLSMSRRTAGPFVPLDQQDVGDWDRDLIAAGEQLLRRAHLGGRIGRFQLEAAIQSVHCDRARTGVTDDEALRRLHVALIGIAPTLGARVSLAAIVGRLDGPAEGLRMLDEIGDAGFQPAWATRAHLLAQTGRFEAAATAYAEAIALTPDGGIRDFLSARKEIIDNQTSRATAPE
jgi:RNA polymerase sigma-70 factor (ECF subfamily)